MQRLQMPRVQSWSFVGVALATLMACTATVAQGGNQGCGSLENAFGPFDYRTERGNSLRLVEGAHFTPQVEALVRGNAGYLGGDLDYTLRAFPNHARALIATMRYGQQTKSPQPPHLRYSVECYFDRALRFRPDDTTVRMIYATFLEKAGRSQEAEQQLERAAVEAKDNPFTHYNIGLVYLEAKNYERALIQAHKAHALGFTRTELKEKLVAAGKWKDPDAVSAPPASEETLSAPSGEKAR
jgi:uncharacterized protein (TIGR02996 family)